MVFVHRHDERKARERKKERRRRREKLAEDKK